MNLDRFRETLIRDEGLNLNRHTVEEIDHIGYGFNLEIEWDDELLDYLDVNDEDEIQSLTQEQADYILDWHIASIEKTIIKRFPIFETLSSLRQECVFNMRFNLGAGGLRGFKMMWSAIEKEDWQEASAQILDSKAAREDAPERYKRLAATFLSDNEKDLELSNVYDEQIDTQDVAVLGDSALAAFTNQEMLAEIQRRLDAKTG